MAKWLIKSDPETYSLDDFIKEKSTEWTGVRNYQARIYLNTMQKKDECIFYHSNKDKACLAIASVTKTAFPDTTAKEGNWVAVVVDYKKSFKNPVTIAQIKNNEILANIPLIKQSRLSVMPLSDEEFNEIVKLGGL